jgi:hypothetical protein
MVELETPPTPQRDPAVRKAALWATVIAVPVAVLVGVIIFLQVIRQQEKPEAAATPAPTAVAAVPATPVTVAAPKLSARAAEVCLAVVSQLPTRLRNLAARKVSAGPEQNAAWGDPPITVACGVAQPQMCVDLGQTGCVPLDTELLNMNRVCWYAQPGDQANVFTTMDREQAVQVTVPATYQQAAQWANEFSDVVVETDASKTKGVPSGCVRNY